MSLYKCQSPSWATQLGVLGLLLLLIDGHPSLQTRWLVLKDIIMKTTQACALLSLALLGEACLLPGEASGGRIARRQNANPNNTGIAIGTGDRFDGGKKIKSAVKGLVEEYDLEYFESPYKTYENASFFGAKIGGEGGNCSDAHHVYFNAAIHARERGSSDNIIYFISDLLYANKHGEGLTYGGRVYTNDDVKRALSTGIVFTPLSNPDGVAYDQATHSCWRKNRNPAASGGNPEAIGIDLNRNFDFLFDFPKSFAPSVGPNVASEDPTEQTYHGAAAFSEPESKSIKWVMDQHKNVKWFLDIHSYIGVILYNWGSDENQLRQPYMNFMNESYDAARGLMPDTPSNNGVYGEYIPSNDWSEKVFAAMRMGNAMDAATGRHYQVEQSSYLYPTSGSSDDYAYSRHLTDPSLGKMHGFVVEFGFGNDGVDCPFYPTPSQYNLNLLETNAGFMEYLLAAADLGVGEPASCVA
ncbi:zinc carboxypeptidase [Colletotrichum scovillei]|uniref:zinc carboxypeptidase n=1 Tax=Colletotrichum scovillei TaxID=1209932 RepID=UPI0015C3FD68|nr:zinc carboxypeptidase [Colletotrichum scovillei]KAF4785537.1 zinc carboxypeptidase [Colletotrichum scovillei]